MTYEGVSAKRVFAEKDRKVTSMQKVILSNFCQKVSDKDFVQRRVLLLHKYGGVWADATLCMTSGLDEGLNLSADFVTLVRHDQKARNRSRIQ